MIKTNILKYEKINIKIKYAKKNKICKKKKNKIKIKK